jgi:aspartyl-tRNA(Asn)/glutamyl-tRNA(Gln) amidotransferase subunit C
MTVDAAALKKLARLAKLAVDDAELRALVPELAAIVRHVDSLRAVDTTGVPPMRHGAPLGVDVDVRAAVRADVDAAVLGRDAVAGSAGFDVDDGTVVVPKVVD